MNGIYHSRRGAAWARSALRGIAGWRGPRNRTQMIVAAATATVLAVGVGIVWGIAGGTDQQVDTAGEPFGDPQSLPGGASGGVLDGLASPGAVTEGGDLPGGSGSGSGAGQGSSGGGSAGNRPPVIEDPGLSSDGMTLTVAPTVTDPDGDPVEVGYDDGTGLVLVSEQPTRSYPVTDSADGYRYPVEVTIHATDASGAAAQETFTHQLEAISTVVVRRIELKLESPQSCFADSGAERFTADLALRGAVVLDRPISEELRPDKPTATLLPAPAAGEVTGVRPRQDLFLTGAALAGEVGSLNLPDLESPVRPRRMFLDSRCQARVSVSVQITTR